MGVSIGEAICVGVEGSSVACLRRRRILHKLMKTDLKSTSPGCSSASNLNSDVISSELLTFPSSEAIVSISKLNSHRQWNYYPEALERWQDQGMRNWYKPPSYTLH